MICKQIRKTFSAVVSLKVALLVVSAFVYDEKCWLRAKVKCAWGGFAEQVDEQTEKH